MTSSEYKYEDGKFDITSDMKSSFDEYGYIMVRNLLDASELNRVKQVVENSTDINKSAFEISDGEGRQSKFSLWNHPGNDVTGMVARCEKVVESCEKLLGGEVYHYHTKLMMKNAFTGGRFMWHQDYGYWYKNGCLFPDMMSVFIAIDKCTKENGCLQILRGSNKCGRIDHVMSGGQTGADLDRVNEIEKVCKLEEVEMEPGDALFFHCNLLHKSIGNFSQYRRWAFVCAYNKASNDPVIPHHHPQYTLLQKVPNSAILECENTTDMSGKDFMNPKTDRTIKVTEEDGKDE